MPTAQPLPTETSLSDPELQRLLDAIHALPPVELPLPADAEPRAGVPRGRLLALTHASQVFPMTTREWWIYLPHGIDRASGPLPSMVFQDGWVYADPHGEVRVPNVLDNLIARGELPPLVAIFINPGVIPPAATGGERTANRSLEYNTLSDHYARFLLEEIYPAAGAYAQLSADPAHRAICGVSSGGICAFLVAWYRSDAFSKVLSHVGSFTDILGGHHVHSLVRKNPRRPIRVLLEGGTHDLNQPSGDWWVSNLQMASALRFQGYDLAVAWTPGRHSVRNGAAILPQSLRWLWRP